MSRHGDVLDDHIRATLAATPIGDHDADGALARVRARARSRRRRRRSVGAVVSMLAVVFFAVTVTRSADDDVVVAGPPATSTSSSARPPAYGFAPLTALVDEPLPVTPRTQVAVRDGRILSVHSEPEKLSISLTDATGAGGSMWGDPQSLPAVALSGQDPASNDPDPKSYLYGVTRAEVARIEVVRRSGTVSIDTIAHEAFPQLRFVFFEEDRPSAQGPPDRERGRFTAYDAHGVLLTDSERIRAESDAFAQEVDRRKGIEDKAAAIVEVHVSENGQTLTFTVFNCGEEPRPHWTVDDATVTVSATVKRPYNEGDCLDGETTRLAIILNQPLEDRTIIDGRTGEPIPHSDSLIATSDGTERPSQQ